MIGIPFSPNSTVGIPTNGADAVMVLESATTFNQDDNGHLIVQKGKAHTETTITWSFFTQKDSQKSDDYDYFNLEFMKDPQKYKNFYAKIINEFGGGGFVLEKIENGDNRLQVYKYGSTLFLFLDHTQNAS